MPGKVDVYRDDFLCLSSIFQQCDASVVLRPNLFEGIFELNDIFGNRRTKRLLNHRLVGAFVVAERSQQRLINPQCVIDVIHRFGSGKESKNDKYQLVGRTVIDRFLGNFNVSVNGGKYLFFCNDGSKGVQRSNRN